MSGSPAAQLSSSSASLLPVILIPSRKSLHCREAAPLNPSIMSEITGNMSQVISTISVADEDIRVKTV